MSQRTMTQTIALRLVVFFARNPDEELTHSDVVEKFGIGGENLRHSTRASVQAGLLERESFGGGKDSIYRAGPQLLRMFASVHCSIREVEEVAVEIELGESLQMVAQACMAASGAKRAHSGFAELTA